MSWTAEWSRLRVSVRADIEAMARLKGRTSLGLAGVVDVIALPGTWAVLMFRIASFCHHAHLRPVSRLFYFLNVVLFGADLAPGATVGPGLAIAHPVGTGWGNGLTVGRDVIMSGMARFGTAASEDAERAGEPTLGDEVVVLDGAKVLGAITIGDRAVLAANALVLVDVPAGAVVVGQPARQVRSRDEPVAATTNRLVAATARLVSATAHLGLAEEPTGAVADVG